MTKVKVQDLGQYIVNECMDSTKTIDPYKLQRVIWALFLNPETKRIMEQRFDKPSPYIDINSFLIKEMCEDYSFILKEEVKPNNEEIKVILKPEDTQILKKKAKELCNISTLKIAKILEQYKEDVLNYM